jgi:sulfur-oxidizing protein SoxZ
MGSPMRIRANVTGSAVEVKILMRHSMDSGLIKNSSGALIPARFIKTVVAKWKDRVVLDALFSVAVSRDPFLSFSFKGGAKGDKISVTWTDNTGDSRTDEAVIA